MLLHFNTDLYSKTALLKAAYHFTDKFYVHLDRSGDDYIVDIMSKTGPEEDGIKGRFSNELLAQAAREKVFEQTSHIRELLLGRAFSSTIIEDTAVEENTQTTVLPPPIPPLEQNDEKLFEDWFETHES